MTLEDWKEFNDYRQSNSILACYNCQYRNEDNECMVASLNIYTPGTKDRVPVYVNPDFICNKHMGDITDETYAQRLQENGVYDSVQETLEHKRIVNHLLQKMVTIIQTRAETHDDSKMLEPEREIFTLFSRKLINNKYGDNDYEKNKKLMKVALDHHYAKNSHHPEHYPDGVGGMDLIDLLEMICDWKAAGLRHKDGDIFKSIEKCSERFNIDPQLKQVLINTAERYLL